MGKHVAVVTEELKGVVVVVRGEYGTKISAPAYDMDRLDFATELTNHIAIVTGAATSDDEDDDVNLYVEAWEMAGVMYYEEEHADINIRLQTGERFSMDVIPYS